MKTSKNLFKIFMSGLSLMMLLTVSCSKDNGVFNEDNSLTITQVVNQDANFSFLRAALTKAELTATLSGNGPFTVFAPNNDAFRAAGFANEAAVSQLSKETLQGILLYHVLPANVPAAAIAQATNTEVTTQGGQKVYVTKTAAGRVTVNGATVVAADLKAKNGTIHVINTVLTPVTSNIVQLAQGNTNLSLLVAAVTRANLATTLSGAGPFTVFAPTNAAFAAAGFGTEAAIQAASPAALTSILTYHVVSGRIFSTDLTEGATPTTVNGGNVIITLAGGAKVKGRGNATAANITAVNSTGTNGVVHVIDQVLLP